jgi:hypothetical protein
MTTIQVYLNLTRDGMGFGFLNQFSAPALALALKFDDDLDTKLIDGMPIAALETVFEQLNVGLEPGYAARSWTKTYRAQRNRSLSTGDVVIVGETAFSVESFGWKVVDTDTLLDAIARGREDAKVGQR